MSKKTTSSTQGTQSTAFQFDPGSMAQYQQNLAAWGPQARAFATNPYGNQQFQEESAMGQDNAARMGSRNMANLRGNAAAMGYSTNGGMFNSLLAQSGRATSGMQANAFRGAVGSANQRQMQSMGMLASFQPLMTGSNSNFSQNSQQQQSGLGTWLPQLIGAGVGAGVSAFTGGGGMTPSSGASSSGSGVGATGSGMGGITGGIGNVFGGMSPSGYGYGSSGGPPPPPPGMWGA